MPTEYTVKLKRPHEKQAAFINSTAKRKIIRAGRRGGKTTGIAILAIQEFLKGRRVLYATPTQDQINKFWFEVTTALAPLIDAGIFKKNASSHFIEVPGTENRIRAKTAWNANTLRGDYADVLILDEFQLMNEDTWEYVGQPMLIDNDGDAVFIYTPPSLTGRAQSKADDPQYAAKMFKYAKTGEDKDWQAFHFTSHDNPHTSREGLARMAAGMTELAYAQEILAEDRDEAPHALWTRELLAKTRYKREDMPDLTTICTGVDPPGGAVECGIVTAGVGLVDGEKHVFIFADDSLQDTPGRWGARVVEVWERELVDMVAVETNFGGDMVENTVKVCEGGSVIRFVDARATRGKAVRAQPIATLFERGLAHLVGHFPKLEDEMCLWEPDSNQDSPNRLDAMVWSATKLGVHPPAQASQHKNPFFG